MKRFSDHAGGDLPWTERCLHEAERQLLDASAELMLRIAACRALPAGGTHCVAQLQAANAELACARTGLELAERAERERAIDRARICLADVRLHARRAARGAQAAAAELGTAPVLPENPGTPARAE
jgi:hypothetical protein